MAGLITTYIVSPPLNVMFCNRLALPPPFTTAWARVYGVEDVTPRRGTVSDMIDYEIAHASRLPVEHEAHRLVSVGSAGRIPDLPPHPQCPSEVDRQVKRRGPLHCIRRVPPKRPVGKS